jgi:hypothetical protein
METNSLLMKAEPARTPGDDTDWLASKRRGGRSVRLTALPALTALCLAVTGCQTFNYTDEDFARERKKLAESYASGGWRGGMGGLGGFSPNIGSIPCPGLGGVDGCPAGMGGGVGSGK